MRKAPGKNRAASVKAKHHLFDGTLWRKVALFHAILLFQLHYPDIFKF